MKRTRLLAVALLAGAGLLFGSGCGSVTTASAAQLSGTYDLAVVGDLVFVTSAYSNELRVIDTTGTPRDFVRAPNPLEPLAIPVVDQPVELARDVRYDGEGAEQDGPYVYARGLGSAEISVVGAAPSQLKELTRVVASSTVTALAARGAEDGTSTLYFATWDGTRGTLWRVSLPSAEALPTATLTPTVIVSSDGEAYRSIAVMPDGHSLALATRSGSGTSGRSLLLDQDTLAIQELAFPAPVRRLFTHPTYHRTKGGVDQTLPAGKRIFGVLDESTCGGQRRCRGLIAVESSTGEISRDDSGAPMVPLVFGRGLINGVTVQPQGTVVDPNTVTTDNPSGRFSFWLLGVVTTTGDSNVTGGEIYFFNADGLQQEETNSATPAVASTSEVDASGTAQTPYVNGPDPDSFQFGDGAVETQSLLITYQGIIPGLLEVASTDADGQRFLVPGVDLHGRVTVGDSIQILAPDAGCTTELTVTSVETDALVTTDAIPAACANRTGFTVRAAGAEPYVVEGSVDGYLGRVGVNEHFTYPAPASFSASSPSCPSGPAYCPVPCPPGQQAACAPAHGNDYSAAYFFHTDAFLAEVPAIQFTFGAGDPAIQRGWQYVVNLSSGYQPLLIGVDTSYLPAWYLPGSVVYHKLQKDDGELNLIYVAYPSAQGVLEFNPATIVPNSLNSTNLVGYQ